MYKIYEKHEASLYMFHITKCEIENDACDTAVVTPSWTAVKLSKIQNV